MPCALTTGFALDCKESVGGIEKIYITELANKATINASGEITTFTLAQGKQFFEFDLREESSSYTETETVSNVNGTTFYEQVLSVTLDPLTTERKEALYTIAKNDVMIIHKDSNGRYWLQGENTGAYSTGGPNQTGQAKGDLSGFTRTYTAKEKMYAREVSSALIASLTTPAA